MPVRCTADNNLPETPIAAPYNDTADDKPPRNKGQSKGEPRVFGPIEYAIDGKNNTAWGIDAGPGQRNQSRKAVFNFETPVSFPKGTVFNIYLAMDHGGANSDNNENNNLGRIRLSVTDAPDPQADPLPQNVRDLLSIPREQRSPAQLRAEFSYWRTTVPEWKDANETIAALWRDYPEGTTQLVLNARTGDHRETHILKRGDFLQPGRSNRELQVGLQFLAFPMPHRTASPLLNGWSIASPRLRHAPL